MVLLSRGAHVDGLGPQEVDRIQFAQTHAAEWLAKNLAADPAL